MSNYFKLKSKIKETHNFRQHINKIFRQANLHLIKVKKTVVINLFQLRN